MSIAKKLKGKVRGKKATKPKTPVWKGPEEDGVTVSLLSRFLVCRERFRLLVVEGLRPKPEFNHKIEYGQMWHICEAAWRGNPDIGYCGAVLQGYCQELMKKYPLAREQVRHWWEVCRVQFPLYLDYWRKHPDVKNRTPLLQEQVFDVPYQLSSGRAVRLRGKWDAVDLIKQGRTQGIWLFEHKTKGDIRSEAIVRQLTFDLQTMFYLVALRAWQEKLVRRYESGKATIPLPNKPVMGVRYNVVRRPLSGGKGSIRQRKATKKTPAETPAGFYGRLGAIIGAEPDYYFYRWQVPISQSDIDKFRQQCLDPILEQLCNWWDWIRSNPRPFHGSLHWRHPFGVYNVLDEGGSHELDEYLASGSTLGLERTDNLFQELTDA